MYSWVNDFHHPIRVPSWQSSSEWVQWFICGKVHLKTSSHCKTPRFGECFCWHRNTSILNTSIYIYTSYSLYQPQRGSWNIHPLKSSPNMFLVQDTPIISSPWLSHPFKKHLSGNGASSSQNFANIYEGVKYPNKKRNAPNPVKLSGKHRAP